MFEKIGNVIRIGYYSALVGVFVIVGGAYAFKSLSRHFARERAIREVVETTCKPFEDQLMYAVAGGMDPATIENIHAYLQDCKLSVILAFENDKPMASSASPAGYELLPEGTEWEYAEPPAIEYAHPGMEFEDWPAGE